eukprot:jgi/Chrzof1/2734/Cz11g27080.t1
MEGHSREVDVAIIGGGPAGLSLAVGLRTALPSLKVAVFERGAALKPKGAAVTLPGNALRALNALGAFQACFADPSTTPLTGVRFLDENDQETSFVSFPEPTDPMQRPMAMTWFKLQCVLLSLLPKHMIHYGTEFQELQQTAEQVVVKFKNGVSVTARIVVGADGNLSAVRAHILDEGPPQYSGAATWRLLVPAPEWWTERTGTLTSWNAPGKLIACRTMKDGSITASAISAWPAERIHELERKRYIEEANESGDLQTNGAARSKYNRFKEAFGSMPDKLVNMFERSEEANIIEHGIYARPPNRQWGIGRVSLMGDAAHVMPPTLGQGTGMALEDALQLVYAIHEHGPTPEALRQYEDAQRTRVEVLTQISQDNTTAYYVNKDSSRHPLKGASGNREELMKLINSVQFKPVSELAEKTCVS